MYSKLRAFEQTPGSLVLLLPVAKSIAPAELRKAVALSKLQRVLLLMCSYLFLCGNARSMPKLKG